MAQDLRRPAASRIAWNMSLMDRRAFIGVIAGGVVLAPFRARGQQAGKIYRIGLLSPFTPADAASWNSALLQGLRDLGWLEGKNIAIERRYSEGKNDRLADLAAELVHLKVDVIVTAVTPDSLAAKNATRTIPIVMAAVGDPVESGLIQSLGRPGGNITGLTQVAPELGGKRLQMLKEIAPRLNRVAVLWNPLDKGSTVAWKEIQQPARELGMDLHGLEVSKASDFDGAFEEATRSHVGALAIMPETLYVTNLKRIADFALKARLLSIFHLAEFVQAGGLIAYGPDRSDLFRRAATYVDKILKGAKPSELPVERPTKFQLVINLGTAKAIGITIPQSLLLRADEVIQ